MSNQPNFRNFPYSNVQKCKQTKVLRKTNVNGDGSQYFVMDVYLLSNPLFCRFGCPGSSHLYNGCEWPFLFLKSIKVYLSMIKMLHTAHGV